MVEWQSLKFRVRFEVNALHWEDPGLPAGKSTRLSILSKDASTSVTPALSFVKWEATVLILRDMYNIERVLLPLSSPLMVSFLRLVVTRQDNWISFFDLPKQTRFNVYGFKE